jgi:hypothetical protein
VASYNADINVNVNVFDRKLRELERRLQALDKIANPKKPLTKAQAAEQIPKLKEEIELNKRAKKLLDDRQEAQAKLKKALRDQVRLRKEELSYEQRSLRLSNARKLQEARLTALKRAGAFEGKGRSTEIQGILRKGQQFSQSSVVQERVATALGRILTLQNAINRAETKSIGQKQRIAEYKKRIDALKRVGATQGELRKVEKRRFEFIEAADKRQDAIAAKRELQLKNEIKLKERKYALELKAFNTVTKPQSSLLSSGPKRTVLGTEEAIRKKAAFYDRKAIKDQREKNRAKREELRLAKLTNKEKEKESKTSDRQASKRKVTRGKFAQNLSAGVGFPLLFGGGPGSIIGGALGALGGFGGSVLGSAIGQQIDNLGKAALDTAKAFGKLGATVEDLLPALGRGAGGGFSGRAQFLASRGRESQVASIARRRFDEVYGTGASKRFEELAEKGKEFDQVLNEIGIGFKNLMAGPLGAILEALKGISPAGGKSESAFVQENRDRMNRISTLLLRQKETGGLSLVEKAELKQLESEVFTRGQTPFPGTEATSAEKDLQALFNEELSKTQKLLDQETKLIKDQLSARRDIYATQEGQLKVAKLTFEIDKLNAQLTEEEKQVNQDILRIAELKESLANKEAQRDQERARQLQAEVQARRAIEKDLRTEKLNQLNLEKSGVATANQRNNLLDAENTIYKSTIQNISSLEQIEADILNTQLEASLVGVNELEVRNAINKTAEYKLKMLEDAIRLQREEAKIAEIARRDAELTRQQSLSTTFTDARRQQQQQIRGLDPSRAFSFAGQGLGFFGQSGLFEANRLAESAAQLEAYNEQIANLQARYDGVRESGSLLNLEDVRRLDSISKEIEAVQAKRDAYEQLQPAVDRAAIFQARYNDALAAVTPGVNSLVSGLMEVVDGTKTAQEAFADFLRVIADQLAQTAATMIAQYIALGIARSFGLGGQTTSVSSFGNVLGQLAGRANGGPVSTGTPYMVGERGPELFVPNNSGNIVPNHALGGDVNVVVNVTETQTDTRGNGARANQVGNALAAAVQAEIIKQKRPGGLLAN